MNRFVKFLKNASKIALLLIALTAPSMVHSQDASDLPDFSIITPFKIGKASFYGTKKDGFLGKKMASGYVLTRNCLYAASKTLPFGTLLLVTNIKNGLSVVVRVMDRGPFVHGRVLDLSHSAAQQIDMKGVSKVKIDIITQKEDE